MNEQTRRTDEPRPANWTTWLGLAVLALPTALLGLDVTLLYLALPVLAVELDASATQSLWIMDAYGFMIAGFLVTMGSLGDRIGRRRLLVWGILAFAAASILAAFSTTPQMLILARGLLGLAGATLMPSTLALISNMFSLRPQRALAIGVWATMFALGMAAGPLLGAWLLERFWWGAAFLVALPVAAVVLLAAPVLLPEYRGLNRSPLDVASAVLSLLAILPAIYALKEAARLGFGLASALALAISIGFAVLFVRRQAKLSQPLLDLTLFNNRTFTTALLILLLGLVSVGGIMLLVTQYLQLVLEFSPVLAGAWMGPPALMMVAAGIAAPLFARRVRPGVVVAVALAISAIGYGLIAVLERSDPVLMVMVGFSLAYLGLGTIAALGTDLVVEAAPPEKAGSASALSEMVQELGIAFGVALLGSLVTYVYRREITASLVSQADAARSAAVFDGMPAAFAARHVLPLEMLEQARSAFIDGLNCAGLLAALLNLGLAALSVTALRPVPVTGHASVEPTC